MMWNLNNFSNNTAIITENGESISYKRLKYEIDKLASNIEFERSLVVQFCSNQLGSLIGYVSFLNYRHVPLMLASDVNYELSLLIIEKYAPEYIWLPAHMTEKFDECEQVYTAWDYVLIRFRNVHRVKMHSDLALLLTTSGSTGSPKFVRQTYQNIQSNTRSIVEYLKIDASERAITTLPMHYTYGLSILNTHLWAGASIILTQKAIVQKEFWDLLHLYEATNFGGVPYTYELLRRLRFLKMDLPSLRYITQAGGKLSKELCLEYAKGMSDKRKHFIVMYGATEATSRMAYVPHEHSVEKAGSIGIAIPGGRFELIDVEGNIILRQDEVGELIYYGENVAFGYAESKEQLIKQDDWHGRLETGDMAIIDEDGYYTIVGRKKRFLKIFGNRINLMEVEDLLLRQGYETACTGHDDHMNIYTTSDEAEKIAEFLEKTTGIRKIAFNIKRISEIPRNSAGKILYSALEENEA